MATIAYDIENLCKTPGILIVLISALKNKNKNFDINNEVSYQSRLN